MISDAQKSFLDKIQEVFRLEGKKVLDVGCGDGAALKYIAQTYAPKKIIGIDPGLASWYGIGESSGPNWEIRNGDAEKMDFNDNSFDAAYSIATFEHIGDVSKCLSEIKRVLKPYGKFSTSFAPLWTSVSGHHCSMHDLGLCKDQTDIFTDRLPPWGHLYMSEQEMAEYLLCQGFDIQIKDYIVDKIYHGKSINRLSASVLKNAIMNCGMIVRSYHEYVSFSRKYPAPGINELDEDIKRKILSNKYKIFDVGIVGMECWLEKYEAKLC